MYAEKKGYKALGIHIHAHMYMHICLYMHIYIHTHTHIYIYIYREKGTQGVSHPWRSESGCKNCGYVCTHYIHACAYAYIHTYAHTYVYTEKKGYKVLAIHGDRSQDARTAAVEKFKSGEVPLLIATDVAAR
jgi:hypothetical protein